MGRKIGKRGNLQREGECHLLEVMFAALAVMVESQECHTLSNGTLHTCAVSLCNSCSSIKTLNERNCIWDRRVDRGEYLGEGRGLKRVWK